MSKFNNIITLVSFCLIIGACSPQQNENNRDLPILGNWHVDEVINNGKTMQDTVYHKIADFTFTNQEGRKISNSFTEGKVYVADFFFTTCPTICPIMKTQMLRVYEKFQIEPDFLILSHTLDPDHDTQGLLKDFAEKIGVDNDQTWHFLTGDQERIFEIGQTSYLTTAMEDKLEPGGILHSGAFVLIDQQGRIRGVYDGTKEEQVDRLMNDIPKILNNK